MSPGLEGPLDSLLKARDAGPGSFSVANGRMGTGKGIAGQIDGRDNKRGSQMVGKARNRVFLQAR